MTLEEAFNNPFESMSNDATPLPEHALIRLVDTLLQTGRADAAVAVLERDISHHSGSLPLLSKLGMLYMQRGAFDKGIGTLKCALALSADQPNLQQAVGVGLALQGKYAEAIGYLEAAKRLAPQDPDIAYNHAHALASCGRYSDAIPAYDDAIRLNPNNLHAHYSKAVALQAIREFKDAIPHFAFVLGRNRHYEYAIGNYLYSLLYLGIWQGLGDFIKQLDASLADEDKLITPFHSCFLTNDPAVQQRISKAYSARFAKPGTSLPHLSPGHGKIRVAYFSSDFYDHATMHLLAGLFECHDRSKFELYAFSFGPGRQDPWRQRAIDSFDRFIDIDTLSDREAANRARELEIDIAVDLKGYTANSRPGIFAERAAPIQVNYMGFPGTMGASFMDYLIGDPVLIPSDKRGLYSEKVVYLPDSYQANDSKRKPPRMTFSRSDAGLPESAFVFCCFNNTYKLLPDMFDIWMRLLKEIEGSVLWLYGSNPTATENLRKEAESRGVEGARLVFAKHLPIEDHLARIPLADLFLDTFPCNAHTTASDALRSGLPIVTLTGETFASRVAASLLNAVGVPELITHDPSNYHDLARQLASDADKLKSIREKLANNLKTTPLYDTALFTRHIESAYRVMYQNALQGLPPDHIVIDRHNQI